MDSEDTSCISTMWSNFLSKTGRYSTVFDGQIFRINPLITMVGCYWLFTCCYKVFLFDRGIAFLFTALAKNLQAYNLDLQFDTAYSNPVQCKGSLKQYSIRWSNRQMLDYADLWESEQKPSRCISYLVKFFIKLA